MGPVVPRQPQDAMKVDRGAPTLVCCVGNALVADDGIACAVYLKLQALALPESTRLAHVGVGGLDLLERLTGEERALIVVDAVQFGAPPGTVHCLDWRELPAARGAAISAHAIGLRETIEVGQVICPEKLPATIMLIGIEGRCFNQLGGAMTPATAAAADGAAAGIRDLLFTFQRGTEDDD